MARVGFLGGVGLGALALAACSGGSSSSTPTSAPAAATAAPSSTPTAAIASPAAVGSADAALVKVGKTSKGDALTDATGMSLYTFDNDKTPGKSSCNGGCATTWPPVITTASTPPSGITGASGAFSIITRDDGTKQIAYNGKPLYRYTPDKAPGDVLGDGVGGVWHLATP